MPKREAKIDSQQVEAMLKRAEALILAKRHPDAFQVATKAIELAPKNPRGYQLRAKAAYRTWGRRTNSAYTLGGTAGARVRVEAPLKERTIAYHDLKKAIQLGARDVETRVSLARVLNWQYEYKLAIPLFDKAIREQPENVDALSGRAQCRLSLNDIKGCVQDADAALKLEKTCIEALLVRAAVNFIQNKSHAMIVDMDQVIQLEPSNIVAIQTRSVAHIRLRNYGAALKDCLAVIRMRPLRARLRTNLAAVYILRKEPAKALPYLAEELKLAESRFDRRAVFQCRTRVYFELKQFKKSLADAQRCLDLSKTLSEKISAYQLRGRVLANLGQPLRAKADVETVAWLGKLQTLEAARRKSPKEPQVLIALAGHYWTRKKWKEAIACYEKAIVLDSKSVFAHAGRMRLCHKIGRHDDVITECAVLFQLNVRSPEMFLLRGDAYLGKKNYDAAIADYTSGRAFGANFAAAYAGRGKAHLAAGRKKAADNDFRRAKAIDPSLKVGPDGSSGPRR